MYCQVFGFFVFQHVRPSPSLSPTTYLRWPDSCILHLAWTSKHTTFKKQHLCNWKLHKSCYYAAVQCTAQRGHKVMIEILRIRLKQPAIYQAYT